MAEHPSQLADRDLLEQCRVETYRASGPGGQKRNKTDSAVRIRHTPTGICATAADSRSQHDNRARALARLRVELAVGVRSDLPPSAPEWWGGVVDAAGRVSIGRKSELYIKAIALAFDALDARRGSLADAAAWLHLSTGHLVDLLATDPRVWGAAQQLRQRHGLPTLVAPK